MSPTSSHARDYFDDCVSFETEPFAHYDISSALDMAFGFQFALSEIPFEPFMIPKGDFMPQTNDVVKRIQKYTAPDPHPSFADCVFVHSVFVNPPRRHQPFSKNVKLALKKNLKRMQKFSMLDEFNDQM